jgi:hypothetical protein
MKKNNVTSYVQVTDLGDLFSAPLLAVVEADFQAAQKFKEYIEEFGFYKREPNSPPIDGINDNAEHPGGPAEEPLGKMRMASFCFNRTGDDGRNEVVKVEIPALSLIPLPLLQVKNAHFDFDLDILEAIPTGEESKTRKGLGLLNQQTENDGDNPLPEPNKYRWRAMLVKEGKLPKIKKECDPHFSSNLRVKVKVEQADMPAGISTLLQVMGENVQCKSIQQQNKKNQEVNENEQFD